MSYQVRPYTGPLQPMPQTHTPNTHGKSPRPLFLTPEATALLANILNQRAQQAKLVYLILWQGKNRIPTNAKIGAWTIHTTQHGQVTAKLQGSTNLTQIGTYARIQDQQGPNHDFNEMLVYLDPMITP